MQKVSFNVEHISPLRQFTLFDQFLLEVACCQFVTAPQFYPFQLNSTSSLFIFQWYFSVCFIKVILSPFTFHTSRKFNVYFWTCTISIKHSLNANVAMSSKMVQPQKSAQRRSCPFSIFIGTKMPFESWYGRGMACEHVNIFIFPCWLELILSHINTRTFSHRQTETYGHTDGYICLYNIFQHIMTHRHKTHRGTSRHIHTDLKHCYIFGRLLK